MLLIDFFSSDGLHCVVEKAWSMHAASNSEYGLVSSGMPYESHQDAGFRQFSNIGTILPVNHEFLQSATGGARRHRQTIRMDTNLRGLNTDVTSDWTAANC